MKLPQGTRRLFPGYAEGELDADRHREFLTARLLEDGDAADLAWWCRISTEEELAGWLERRGPRQLSRRSHAFWALVLRATGPQLPPEGPDVWPL